MKYHDSYLLYYSMLFVVIVVFIVMKKCSLKSEIKNLRIARVCNFLCLKFLTFNGSLQRPLSHFRDTTRRCSRPSFLTVILLRAPLSTDVPFLLLNHSIVTRRQRCNFSWENLLASYAKPLGITLSICLTFWSHLPSIWRFYCGHVTSRKILVKAVFFCTNQMLFFQQLSQR